MAAHTKTVNRAYMHAALKTLIASALSFLATANLVIFGAVSVHAAGLSFGYKSGDGVVNGMIVSVKGDNTDSVEPANVNNASYVVGVAIDPLESAVVLDDNDSVYVAAEGSARVFVSNLNGDIEAGDLITVSTIDGVGRKKSDGVDGEKVVGVAKASFNKSTPGASKQTLENAGDVSVGLIEIELLVGDPSTGSAADDGSNVLVRIGRKIAGKPVSLGQMIITATVVIVAFFVSGALLYGSMRGSFISIGRNPLSAKTIYQGMARSILVSLSVMMLGIVGGYVVLLL